MKSGSMAEIQVLRNAAKIIEINENNYAHFGIIYDIL